LFRQGIRTLISAEADMEVVGEASNGGDAVDKANELRPDVVLMDIGMPGLSSFEATRQIKKNRPETKVLFLAMYDDGLPGRGHGSRSQRLRAQGQSHPKARRGRARHLPRRQLFESANAFAIGGRFPKPHQIREPATALCPLTTREREVLKMLAEGQSVKEIACSSNLSVKTVEAHKFNLMRKLDIHNKAQLVQYAIQKKIIKIPNLVPG